MTREQLIQKYTAEHVGMIFGALRGDMSHATIAQRVMLYEKRVAEIIGEIYDALLGVVAEQAKPVPPVQPKPPGPSITQRK